MDHLELGFSIARREAKRARSLRQNGVSRHHPSRVSVRRQGWADPSGPVSTRCRVLAVIHRLLGRVAAVDHGEIGPRVSHGEIGPRADADSRCSGERCEIDAGDRGEALDRLCAPSVALFIGTRHGVGVRSCSRVARLGSSLPRQPHGVGRGHRFGRFTADALECSASDRRALSSHAGHLDGDRGCPQWGRGPIGGSAALQSERRSLVQRF
jgi:hypothetical protein